MADQPILTSLPVPTQEERQGDFGLLCTQAKVTFNTSGICSVPAGQLVNAFSPLPFPQNAFPFNELPGVDPFAQSLLPFFPLPNQPSLGPKRLQHHANAGSKQRSVWGARGPLLDLARRPELPLHVFAGKHD